jgi:hypothetical protein
LISFAAGHHGADVAEVARLPVALPRSGILANSAIDEIQELLADAGAEVSLEEAKELAELIAAAGGVEEALDLLALLKEHRNAA